MSEPRLSPHIVRVEGAPRACGLCVRRAPPVPGFRLVCLAASPGFGLVGFLACAAPLPAVHVSGCLVTLPVAIVDVQLYSLGRTWATVIGSDLGEAG